MKNIMKQFIKLQLTENNDYFITGKIDLKFYLIHETLTYHLSLTHCKEPNLLDWLYDIEKTVHGDEFFDIRKKKETIALYDRSGWLEGEEYRSIFPDENKRFDMTYKNFEEILLRWEELRVSMPETILIVIHEDNHVSLETDPLIIKEYQDAGYAFDINKTP